MTDPDGVRFPSAPTGADEVVARDAELADIGRFVTGDQGAVRVLVLQGEPGIGKTTLWEAGVAAARRDGIRVLSARASDAETALAFAALVDLFDGVGPDALADLPPPQRRALDVALLRTEPNGAPPERHAICLGHLTGLRALAAAGRVLVAVDDIQWLDAASATVLAFAVRRLSDEPVCFLLSRRPGPPSPLEGAAPPGALRRLDIEPQSLGAIRQLLAQRLDLRLSRHTLRQVFDGTLGNPLFALEVGRLLAQRPASTVGEDLPVPKDVEELLGTRVAQLTAPVRRLVLALALDADLRVSELQALAGRDSLEAAVESGLLLLDGDRARPFHPLLAAAAKSSAPGRELRLLHDQLATVVSDEEQRALHVALGTTDPDEARAAQIVAAAARAAGRGCAGQAVLLADHALRLTPRESPTASERLLVLAEYLKVAGAKQRLTDLVTGHIASLTSGAQLARAHLLLTSGEITSNDDIRDHLERGLAEAGPDPALRAPLLAALAENEAGVRVANIGQAEAWALEALEVSPLSRHDERLGLYSLAWARSLGGRPVDDVCARFRAASRDSYYITESPERVAGQRLVWRGEITRAREALTTLLVAADERGEPSSYALQRLHLCELELRAGRWEAAEQLLDEWAESADSALLHWPMYERCRALARAGVGDAAAGRRWGTEAVARSVTSGVRWDWLEAHRALGTVALLERQAQPAVEALLPVWLHTQREGVADPGAFPVAPDLVEALVEVGDTGLALEVTARLRDLAVRQDHPWATASEGRCAATVRLGATTYDEDAVTDLEEAVRSFDRLGLAWDAARTLLALGRAQRRFKKWGTARHTLERAVAAFTTMGSPGWAEEVRAELSRVGARRPASAGALTATEQRVAHLAAQGLANKQIASTLVVTVNTVEFHLRNAYTKLGIRSRGQLAAHLSRIGTPES